MALKFIYGQYARFYPNFPIISFGKMDFSLSFWLRVDLFNINGAVIMENGNFENYRFLKVI